MERGTVIRRGLRALGGLALASLLLGGASGLGAVGAAGSTGAVKPIPGWPGGLTSYEGRYRLITSSNTAFANAGMLTIFGRTVPHQAKPQMSGILALYTTDGTNVVYLTHFVHAGTKLSARVNLGIYTGPEIATFNVVSHQGTSMLVKYLPLQGTSISLHFSRISSNPHP